MRLRSGCNLVAEKDQEKRNKEERAVGCVIFLLAWKIILNEQSKVLRYSGAKLCCLVETGWNVRVGS